MVVVVEEAVQGEWDAAPARAMMAALTEREVSGRGRGRGGWYASEETAKQAGRAAEQTMLGLSVHLGKGLDGRFIVALPSETEWRDPCSHVWR